MRETQPGDTFRRPGRIRGFGRQADGCSTIADEFNLFVTDYANAMLAGVQQGQLSSEWGGLLGVTGVL
jgi:hypothetical protein